MQHIGITSEAVYQSHILETQNNLISIYRNSYDTKGVQTTLDTIYKLIRTGAKGLAKKTKKARKLATTDPVAYKKYKAANFIAPTFAGVFPPKKRQAAHLGHHSGYIVLDIDDIQPLTLYALIAHLKNRDDIILAFLSPSGTGLKVIVRISPIPQNADEHKAAYKAVLKHFKDLAQKYQFTFDQSGSDCSRLCYLTHDRDAIYHPNATPITWDREKYRQVQATLTSKKPTFDFDRADIDTAALDYVDPTHPYENPNAYDTWYKVGIAIKSAGLPFDVWDTWSQRDPKYQHNAPGEMLRKWDSFTDTYAGHSIGWGTVVHYAKQHGYKPPPRTTPPLLQIDTTKTEARKAQRASQTEGQTQLNKDILRFINALKTAIPQFTILPHGTGEGKSTSTLIRAKEKGNRVISLLKNHQLATDQTTAAQNLGFKVHRFLGRGYNFEKSKLAQLPVAMREQDETLFDKHNVTCPINDVIEKTTAKRVSPLYNCLNCPLLATCKQKGYWSQFKQIQHADYLSISLQSLVFNPDLWAFLGTVVSGKIPFEDTETDEDTIKGFDFVMIDDYQVSGLYTDVSYTIEELSDLMRAWHGTKTGEVIETILRALWELQKHQKAENTEPAIKILRELFLCLDADTFDQINENLTLHAHRTEAGELEPISPWVALGKGVKLEALTPLWHSKDWTLLHQLRAMLAYCKNDAQAPIYQIITKETQQVTFTIPPQIHPQMNKVLFLSATADIEATQAAFYGKKIDWTLAEAIPTQLAEGVRLFQYVDSRMTASSVFETERATDDTLIYTEDGKPKRTGALTPRAREILNKVTALVKPTQKKSLFCSYKEFVDGDFVHLAEVQQLHDVFDTITHYDIASGRNFDDYKIFVIFGYPKIPLRAIKKAARRQYAHDPDPLYFDYEYITITENGYTSKARRFRDPRVEKVRRQLTTDKLKQAIGRARITRWERTIVLCISNEPIPRFTELAKPFTFEQLLQAENIEDIANPSPPPTDPLPPITTREKIISMLKNDPDMTHQQIAQKLGITRQAVSKSFSRIQTTTGLGGESHIMQPNDTIPIKYLIGKSGGRLRDVTLQKGVTLREQILNVLSTGEQQTAGIIEQVDGHVTAIKNVLKCLLQAGMIEKVKHGVYTLPKSTLANQNACEDERSDVSQNPKPRPPIPSKKPKPAETEIEKPTPTYPQEQPPRVDVIKTLVQVMQSEMIQDWTTTAQHWLDTDAFLREINKRSDISDSEKPEIATLCIALTKDLLAQARERVSKFGVY